jgi:nucleotide-binding universal stress UspA family protein
MAKILVPLDGSELGDKVVDELEQLLRQEPCEALLVHVIPRATGRELPGEERLERSAAQEHLDMVRQRLEALGAQVDTLVSEGDPAEELLTLIDDHHPSLVAMSSHGRSGVARWVLGSVAERVARDCPTPVLLVTPQATSRPSSIAYRRILVPLDGTEASARSLPYVEELARRHGAEVLLARIEWEALNRPYLAVALTAERIAESLAPWQERLAAHGVRARSVVARGNAAAGIVELAEQEDVDLIVMTTHGRQGVGHLLDGSVAEKVLRHAKQPLLVLH